MIIYNNQEFRNLEEQVQKNKEDIAAHYAVDRVVAEFGIRVVGQLPNSTPLEDGSIVGENYGDAYAVGVEPPYDIWIWTRADESHENPYFFNIGPIAVVGPEGPQGQQGIQGPRGENTRWYIGSTLPTGNFNEGDTFLRMADGTIYSYTDGYWVRATGSIRGPQGIQGPQGLQGERGERGAQGEKGERGDVGGFIHIVGVLNSTAQLPSPTIVGDLTVAYLVGEEHYLYIQVGRSSVDAVWENAGTLNVATYVTIDGIFQNVWESDTKVDKVTSAAGYTRLYAVTANGAQGVVKMSASEAEAGTIPQRGNYGVIKVGTPLVDEDAATKKYVDDLMPKVVKL